jgi:hypothetical protein
MLHGLLDKVLDAGLPPVEVESQLVELLRLAHHRAEHEQDA